MFVLAYNNIEGNQVSVDSSKSFFLPRVKIENYNIEIDGRNSYDQSIVDLIKQCDKIRIKIDNNANVSNDDNAPSFKYKAILVIQKTME